MNRLVTILTTTYPHDAHMAKTYLESEGIEVILKDELMAQVYNFNSNAIGGVKLQVLESDVEKGLTILKSGGYVIDEGEYNQPPVELIQRDSLIDHSICPFCQSENIGKKREPSFITVIVYFILGAIFPIFRSHFKCFDCEKEWKFIK